MTRSPSAPLGTKPGSAGPSGEAKHPRRATIMAAVVVLAVGGTAYAVMASGDDEPARVPLFVSSTHQISYEVSADSPGATAESIQYVVAGGNKVEEVEAPRLPWKISIPLEVGPGGGIAQVVGGNGGAGALSCVLKVDGKVVFAVTAPKETDVGCSSAIAPATR